jgi:hypothetical protein
MSNNNNISIKILGEEVQIGNADQLPVAIDYVLEDEADFRQKKSGTGLNINIPATPINSKKLAGIYDTGSMDTTPGELLSKPMDAVIITGGDEFYKGKAFALRGRKRDGKPHSFDINFFGDNADWVIPLKETTVSDCLNSQTHIFDKAQIEASWNYDGTNENQDFVYAPFRSREAFGTPDGNDVPDMIFRPVNMRPTLFLYWILIRGFRSVGYKVDSQFFESSFFKRLGLLWTWGNFFYITDKLLKEMGFLATGPITVGVHGNGSSVGINSVSGGAAFSWAACNRSGPTSSTVNDVARFDSSNNEHNFILDNVTTDIGYVGNPLEYSYNPVNGEATWEYLTTYASLGVIEVGFQFRLSGSVDCSFNSNGNINVEIFVNGTLFQTFPDVIKAVAPVIGTATDFGTKDLFFQVPNLNPGDTVTARITYHVFESTFGFCFLKILGTGNNIFVHPFNLSQPPEDVRSFFTLRFIRRQLGSVIEWNKFDRFKEFKFLDLLRGVVDDFNLQFNTDPVTKTVLIEPTHGYNLTGPISNPTGIGFYNGKVIDWSYKRDLSKDSTNELFQDFERDVLMRLKDDPNDGLLKLLQDRTQTNMTGIKYLFPERFKKGNRDFANRFFSGVVHYNHDKWKNITGISPQLIALIPENISNTSNPESESTFQPKLVYYKGLTLRTQVGGWDWDGDKSLNLPYLFAVNYKPGGENDPILTYNDQRIGNAPGPYQIGVGLFKRFFWQRFAIMRHGRRYNSDFRLNNSDVTGTLHREYKEIDFQRYQLLSISKYRPMADVPCNCSFWKIYPVTIDDANNTFPSVTATQTGVATNNLDVAYSPLICLTTDIPV